MLIASLIAAAALADPDGVVTTAPSGALDLASVAGAAAPSAAEPTAQDAAPHGLTTEEQIQHWLASRAPAQSFEEAVAAAAPEDDRQMHGMVEAGIGTGGYRSFGAAVSLPVGENGRLDLAYREGRNEPYLWGYPGAFSPVYGLNRYPGYGGGRSRTMSMGFSWSKDRQGEDDRWGDGPRGGLLD